jgi:hypothetical protein
LPATSQVVRRIPYLFLHPATGTRFLDSPRLLPSSFLSHIPRAQHQIISETD